MYLASEVGGELQECFTLGTGIYEETNDGAGGALVVGSGDGEDGGGDRARVAGEDVRPLVEGELRGKRGVEDDVLVDLADGDERLQQLAFVDDEVVRVDVEDGGGAGNHDSGLFGCLAEFGEQGDVCDVLRAVESKGTEGTARGDTGEGRLHFPARKAETTVRRLTRNIGIFKHFVTTNNANMAHHRVINMTNHVEPFLAVRHFQEKGHR